MYTWFLDRTEKKHVCTKIVNSAYSEVEQGSTHASFQFNSNTLFTDGNPVNLQLSVPGAI